MSIGFWQILVVLLIILIVFGSSRIKSIGSDLGKALKGFKKEIKDEDDPNRDSWTPNSCIGNFIFCKTRKINALH